MAISLSLPSKSNISLSDESKNSGIDLSLPSKSKVDLSLQNKNSDLKWEDASWSWDDADDSKWEAPKLTLSKSSKSKVNLSLESK